MSKLEITVVVVGLTDLAKGSELLPAGNQTAASGNAVTFARYLGPFDDRLRNGRWAGALVP